MDGASSKMMDDYTEKVLSMFSKGQKMAAVYLVNHLALRTANF